MPQCCGRPMVKCGTTDSGAKQRYRCQSCGTRTTGASGPEDKDSPGYDVSAAARSAKIAANRKRKVYVVTCAQNNTAPFSRFFSSLRTFCDYHDALLLVVPSHHKNISLYTASQEYQKQWDPVLWPHIVDTEIPLGGGVVLRADIRIGMSSLNPLQGKEPINGTDWVIFGHPQFAMQPVSSPGGEWPKRMYTSGSITPPNYSRTDQGARAEFHHVMGALLVDVLDGQAHIRQLNADKNGVFHDLDKVYSPRGVKRSKTVAALTTGDEHVKFHSAGVRRATYDAKDSICATLRPRHIVRHDVLDGYAGSHHHELDDVTLFKKHHTGSSDYRAELDQVVQFINETTTRGAKNVIVSSNHHDHLYKWLSRVDPRKDPVNALLIHELKAAQYANALAGKTTDPFEIYLAGRLSVPYDYASSRAPYLILGVDYSQHGHVGANGSRGSARALAKSSRKMVIGHSHGARIERGIYQVGTSADPMEYERGLGDHSHTHCVQYESGKRTLIDIFGDKWRGNV